MIENSSGRLSIAGIAAYISVLLSTKRGAAAPLFFDPLIESRISKIFDLRVEAAVITGGFLYRDDGCVEGVGISEGEDHLLFTYNL